MLILKLCPLFLPVLEVRNWPALYREGAVDGADWRARRTGPH
jgi:hypothetical protein